MKKSSPDLISSRHPKAELKKFFNSRQCRELKEQICEFGRRMWQRAYVEGNGGNLAVRVGADLAICTPTMVSKGFMKPEDLCLVDLDGNQLLGARKRTSEILMHLQMMKHQPKTVASCHCHPPHATAFALIFRESAEVDRVTRACLADNYTCWPVPSAFVRYVIYAAIGMVEVIMLFLWSLRVEQEIRNRNYAPEWR